MPSSSLILSVGSLLLSSTAFATKYQQEDSYNGKNWLDAFKFETYDLNNGYVNYLNEEDAKRKGLYAVSGDDVLFGVDSTETLDYTKGPGRKSVRFEGKKNYNKGLFILDVKRMPGVCGMWPAFWSLGQEPWPVKGEIDIIEGVNDNKVNKYVLHTDTKCKVDGLGQSNPQAGRDCALDTAGSGGCDVNEVRTNSFGPGFNANQGGHYVMEWDSDAIKTWFFPRGSSPSSLTSENPDTSEFGTPAANFKGDCDIDQRFKDQRFIFTNNFCGDWAGNAYASSGCPMQKDDVTGATLSPMDSCKKFVAKNPQAFVGQYWQIGSFKTFNKKSVVSSSASSSMVSSSASSSVMSSSSVQPSSTPVSSSSILSSTPVSSSSHAVSSSVMSSSASSSIHVSVSSSASSSAVSSVHSASSVSSDIPSSSSMPHVSSSASIYYPSGQSSAVYPSSSPASSSAPVHYYGNFSAPVSYSVPVYSGSASLPVYGDNAKSTPCTTSSAKGASSTPPAYPVYPNSAPNYGDYPSYPVSSPVKNDYPYLPSFTLASAAYPPTTSKATYDDYYQPPVSKTTITTTYTTTYVDVCETGYTTKTTTFAVTYCPTTTPAVPTPGKPNNPPTYGWDIKTTVCNKGCGEGPKTVTVTVPCTKCDYVVKSTPTPAVPNKPVCNGYDCVKDVTSTTKIYQTKIITLTKVPVPEAPKSSPPVYGGDKPSSKPNEAPKSTPPVVSKPVVPASSPVISKPLVPTGTPGKPSNGTISISVGTGVKPTPSKTGYAPPVFTGAAASVQVGGFVAVMGVVAAMLL